MDEPVTPTPAPAPVGSKPDPLTRFLAFFIDAVIVSVVGLVPIIGSLVAIAYALLRDGLHYEFMDGRSIGKKLMKLKVVRHDGSPMDMAASARRNWPLAVGSLAQGLLIFPVVGWVLVPIVVIAGPLLALYEAYKVVTEPEGRRWGDALAGTKVVQAAS
ncbi:MAG: RDD family protein [Trueperaceae bacterium]